MAKKKNKRKIYIQGTSIDYNVAGAGAKMPGGGQ